MAKATNIIKREGYELYFVDPKDDEKLNSLRNSGKVFGEITVSAITVGDSIDEVILAIR